MALKDWKKLGEDRYKLKDGVGEVWIEQKYHTVKGVSTAVRGANSSKYYTKISHIFNHHYLGDGGHPDPKTFDTKAKAHSYLMKHIKTKNY